MLLLKLDLFSTIVYFSGHGGIHNRIYEGIKNFQCNIKNCKMLYLEFCISVFCNVKDLRVTDIK